MTGWVGLHTDVILALTDDGQLYRSVDGGTSWVDELPYLAGARECVVARGGVPRGSLTPRL